MEDVWKVPGPKVSSEAKILTAAQFNNNSSDSAFMPVSPALFRHVWEAPLMWVSAIVTIAVYIGVLVGVATGVLPPLFTLILIVPICVYVYRAVKWGKVYSSGVMVTQEQFSDVWVMVNSAAREYGCGIPDAFIFPGSGELKVESHGHEHRRYIVISSDFLELGGKGRSNSALEFAIYNSMAHISAGHRDYWRIVLTMVGRYLPLLGKSLSRAESYTADFYAMVSCPQGAIPYVGALSAGKYAGDMVDYTNIGGSGNSSPWVVIANSLSRVPLLSWRAYSFTESVGGPRKGALFLTPHK